LFSCTSRQILQQGFSIASNAVAIYGYRNKYDYTLFDVTVWIGLFLLNWFTEFAHDRKVEVQCQLDESVIVPEITLKLNVLLRMIGEVVPIICIVFLVICLQIVDSTACNINLPRLVSIALWLSTGFQIIVFLVDRTLNSGLLIKGYEDVDMWNI
jgi:hypothetical protein